MSVVCILHVCVCESLLTPNHNMHYAHTNTNTHLLSKVEVDVLHMTTLQASMATSDWLSMARAMLNWSMTVEVAMAEKESSLIPSNTTV